MLDASHLSKSVRDVLVSVCGLTPEEALEFGQHNTKHVLPDGGNAVREAPWEINKLGRWSQSSAKDPVLRPLRDQLILRHDLRVRVMSDIYAQVTKAERPITIIKRTCDVFRAAAESWANEDKEVPLWGGWDRIPARPQAAIDQGS